MNISAWIRPFEKIDLKQRLVIIIAWIVLLIGSWLVATGGQKHLFPTPAQVLTGFQALYAEGLVVHIGASLLLAFKATIIALVISLLVAYLSLIPLFEPVAKFLSKLRYLPLTGITFYLAILVQNARNMQVSVLVVFMSLYLITSMLSVLSDIPSEEIDHAKSLKCSRWEVLWEVVVKGRFDYVLDVLRQNLAIVWMMLVTVESIMVASGGLGVLIKNSDKFMNHGRLVSLQIVILLVGLLLDYSLNTIRKSFFKYSNF